MSENLSTPYPHIPLPPTPRPTNSTAAAADFFNRMRSRRSVRFFSNDPVPIETIRWCIAAAATAPSGANKQPWRFIAIQDVNTKRAIREAAEQEEQEFYSRRATPQWLDDLAPLGTDPHKPFLETAPWLIVVCKLMHTDPAPDGTHGKVYYVDESVGIATGILLSALHHAGLVTLTHTPSPMGFLTRLLNRPAHERAFLLLPVGYPAADATVPDITRKHLDQVMITV
jgi:iodotyrosine deiodinase